MAGGLLTLFVAWKALTEYILWNEASSNLATTYWVKALLRVMVYGAVGAALPYLVFSFGIQLGGALVAAPAESSLNLVALLVNGLVSPSSLVPTWQIDLLVIALLVLVVLVALVVVFLQIFIRGAELALYVIASPIMALGWLSPDGGIWQSWWRGLVILSMSLPIQWLALHGLIATVVIETSTKPLGAFVAVLEMLAWAWVAIRGPHVVQQWAYRTGVGSMAGTVGGMVIQQGGWPRVTGFIGGKVG